MDDKQLSLAVAKVMWPEIDWHHNGFGVLAHKGDGVTHRFDHTTDNALGKMCIWLASNEEYQCSSTVGGPMAIRTPMIDDLLTSDNPHDAIAQEIVRIGGK